MFCPDVALRRRLVIPLKGFRRVPLCYASAGLIHKAKFQLCFNITRLGALMQ